MNTQNLNGKSAILYARCSTNEKKQSTKIQIEQLKKFCNENGITVIDDSNFNEFINKYIKKVEVWAKEGFKIVIKVFVNDNYIGDNWHDYKQYEAFNHRGEWIKPLPIESNPYMRVYYRGNDSENLIDTIGGGMYWETKVMALPK